MNKKQDYEIKFEKLLKKWKKMTPIQRYKVLVKQMLTSIKYFGEKL